jgi:hypothetical protein
MTETEVTSELTDAVHSGQAHIWPGRSPRYWHCEVKAFIQDRLLEVAGTEALCTDELVARAAKLSKGCSQSAVENERKALTKAGRIAGKKIFGPSVLYYVEGSYRALITGSLRVLREKLRKAGITDAEIESELTGAAPPPASPVQAPEVPAAAPASASPSVLEADLRSSILDAIRQLQPAHGAPVSAHRLRAAVPNAGKQAFDEIVLKLADEQLIHVIRHDHGWALPKNEQDELIFDGGDALYAAVAFRT